MIRTEIDDKCYNDIDPPIYKCTDYDACKGYKSPASRERIANY